MQKQFYFAFAVAAALASCSSDDVVNETVGVRNSGQVPIGFNVQKQNITRAANLETVKHYNFGVWAWKVNGKNSATDAEVMNNYLVGWSNGSNTGYNKDKATTYATSPGTVIDHTSPWFYEGLGTSEYTYSGTDGFYKNTDADYMSKNTNQYLRYWDLAYGYTNFYCYAPYNKTVQFEKKSDFSVMTFNATTIRDGYDEPQNTEYNAYSRTLGEFMYAGVRAKNSDLADVTVPFKHMGAQLFIRFYEEIPGYKVEIIDLSADNGKTKSGLSGDILGGIQATPAIAASGSYSNGSYHVTQGATVRFGENSATPNYTPFWTGSTTKNNTTPLMFKIPTRDLSTKDVAPANLTYYPDESSKTWSIIEEKVATGSTQKYSYSPTIYYPVAQPTTSSTGFTFHISYRVIAEDNHEVITVHNATVHVPYKGTATVGGTETTATEQTEQYITVWQPNVKYTYTFKFTKNTTGTTDPDTTIDPTDPTPSDTKALFPIVFDCATIDDYSVNFSEYTVSEGTNYNQTVTP